jgi:PAS domain-containing protein
MPLTAHAIIQTVRDAVAVDSQLRVWAMNEAFGQLVGLGAGEGEGRVVFDLGDAKIGLSSLRSHLESLLKGGGYVEGVEVRRNGMSFIASARRIELGRTEDAMLSVALFPADERPR